MEEKLFLGKRIKRLRSRFGWTQDQLAERVRISPKYLSNIERGKENPTLDLLLRLAQALKVDLWEMFVFDGELPINTLATKKKITQLLNEAQGERLLLAVRLLQAALH